MIKWSFCVFPILFVCFVFNWAGLKPRRSPNKGVRPRPFSQGAQYELTNIFLFFEIYNVNYKGEVGTVYLCFRAKSNSDFFCLSELSLPRPVLSLYINSWVPSETWGQNQLWSFKLWDTKLDRVLATNEQVQKKTFRSVLMQ